MAIATYGIFGGGKKGKWEWLNILDKFMTNYKCEKCFDDSTHTRGHAAVDQVDIH